MENFLFISVAGIGAYLIYRNVFGLKSSRQQTTPARDHPAGNRVPVKTTEPFAKISSYLFSPFDPFNNPSEEFYDADNMPRRDYLLPGGKRLVTYGFKNMVKSSKPGHPQTLSQPGDLLAPTQPIQTVAADKNLNAHNSLLNSYLNA